MRDGGGKTGGKHDIFVEPSNILDFLYSKGSFLVQLHVYYKLKISRFIRRYLFLFKGK